MKPKEAHIWKDILPSMMSEEEEAEDGACIFRRRRQAWKSRKFSYFLDKLDNRLKKTKSKISIPARERCYGDPLDVPAPTAAKSWLTAVSGSPHDKENIDPSSQSGESSGDEGLSSDSGAD